MERVVFVGGIAASYVWRRRNSVVSKEKECVAVDSSYLELGATTQRGSMVALVNFFVAFDGGVKRCAVWGNRGSRTVRRRGGEGRERFRTGWSSASGVVGGGVQMRRVGRDHLREEGG